MSYEPNHYTVLADCVLTNATKWDPASPATTVVLDPPIHCPAGSVVHWGPSRVVVIKDGELLCERSFA